jgi:hypothetical protein
MRASAKPLRAGAAGRTGAQGTFVPPTVLEIGSLAELKREVFGPVLHIVRYRRADLARWSTPSTHRLRPDPGRALAHRRDHRFHHRARAHVGNIYVNRNIVGAVVGVQPFGGEGKSGTGPKAGGPLYLYRLTPKNRAPALVPGIATTPVGAAVRRFDLPAIAIFQSPSMLTDMPPSLASQLPQCFGVFVKLVLGSNITAINHPVQPLFPRLRLGPTPISGRPPCPRRCSVPAIWLSSCMKSLMPRA